MDETTAPPDTTTSPNDTPPPLLIPETTVSPVPISTPTPSETGKVRKARGPDKKPRKKKSDASSLVGSGLEDVQEPSSSSGPSWAQGIHNEHLIAAREVMDYLLNTIAPEKKRKRGPNKNPKAKKVKLEAQAEEYPATPQSFPSATVPHPQQSFSFVMKTVEELLPNWNFNEYMLGLPYQLANPREVTLNMRIQEATERINAFNLLTNPSSSTYDPTLSSRRVELVQHGPTVPPIASTVPPVAPVVTTPKPVIATPKNQSSQVAPQQQIQQPQRASMSQQQMQHLQQTQQIQQMHGLSQAEPFQMMQAMQHQQQQMMWMQHQYAAMAQAAGHAQALKLTTSKPLNEVQKIAAPTPKPEIQSKPVPSTSMSQPTIEKSEPSAVIPKTEVSTPVLQPLTPLNIQNLLPSAQCTTSSSGRTTATLTPGLNAVSDSSNNSSPTC